MTQALVAVFDKQAGAQQANDALLRDGFSRNNVKLTSAEGSNGASSSENSGHDESLGEKISHMFGFGKDDDKKTYSEAVRRGNCVLTVDVDSDDEARRAEAIMERHGPVDIDEHSAQWQSESSGKAGSGEAGVIPIVEEEVRVGKREGQRGGVRVRSHNYEKPVEEDVNLHEQHTQVSRRPADRSASEADKAYGEVDREFRDTAEEAVVSKDARVVEEVVVDQKSSDRNEKVKDSVRRTDVDVEKLDDDKTTSGSKRTAR